MTNTEILTKAIEKAIDGGWKGLLRNGGSNKSGRYYYPDGKQLLKWRWEENEYVFSDGEYDGYESINVEAVIFNRQFAKALWGELPAEKEYKPTYEWNEELGRYNNFSALQEIDTQSAWQYHLQMMVIAEDPIKYLGEHLDG